MADGKALFYYGDPLQQTMVRLYDVGDYEDWDAYSHSGISYTQNNFETRYKNANDWDIPASSIFNLLAFVGPGEANSFDLWANPQKISGFDIDYNAGSAAKIVGVRDRNNSVTSSISLVDLNTSRYSVQFLECHPCICHVNNQATLALLVRYDVQTYGPSASFRCWGLSVNTRYSTAMADIMELSDLQSWDPNNPYDGRGKTMPGGGQYNKQNWNDWSDSVEADAMPIKSAMGSGMVSVFHPSEGQVANLAGLLYSYNFFDWVQKNAQNIDELLVSFAIVPFECETDGVANVTFLGFDVSSWTNPIYLNKAAKQYYEFDMGSISFDGTDGRIHTTDSVFDFAPYSKLGIYLPFIGYEELDIDEFRGRTVNLKYRIDVLSGTTIALITTMAGNTPTTLYQFSGNCLTQIPLGSTDMSSVVNSSVQLAVTAASAGIATSLASAGDAAAAGSSMAESRKDLASHQRGAEVANAANSLDAATANAIMGMKPHYKHSGAIGSSSSLFGVKQPFFFLSTPNEAVPEFYEKYCGLPCNITGKLNEFSGFTVVENIRLNGLVATSPEVEEIYKLLKTGVII